MHKICILAVAVAVGIGVQGLCPPDVVKRIKNYREGKSHKKVLHKMLGGITWLTTTPYFHNNSNAISCFKTMIDSKGENVVATDVLYTRSGRGLILAQYNMVEREPAVITETGGNADSQDEKLYVIYLKNNLMAFYQCQEKGNETYKAFAGVAVVNVELGEYAYTDITYKDITRAVSSLTAVRLEPLSVLNIDC